MNLDKYKGKTLDSETLTALAAEIEASAQALEDRAATAEDKARKAAQESISGRKGKDAIIAKALEKLGIDNPDDLDNLPDSKGQADALKQYETKVKRLERDLGDKTTAFDEVSGRYASERRARAIAEVVSKHPFIDSEDASALIGGRVKQEGEDLLFASPDGKLVPLADGVAWFAKNKPHLVRAEGTQGQGSGFKGQRESAGSKTYTREQFEGLSTVDKFAAIKAQATITD